MLFLGGYVKLKYDSNSLITKKENTDFVSSWLTRKTSETGASAVRKTTAATR